MSDDRRSETRIDEKTKIFIEVCSASFDNTSPANIIICNSLDLSANGLQVEIDQEVAIGAILRLCAEFGDDETLYLVGETKWVKPAGEHFNVGFELYDAENTDIIGWKKLIAAMLD
ncbi:MAG: PilZ domain-containing protein [Oceanicoccus sp.]|uniref:PilZ domain-containing protein n=1 Tax=Oceanicoccus sp. TaxID=2691044 RepID=UPI002630E36E|nr:PilZ domain-containing protein [Oceanicoccus sp.]MDG1772403.1 PilZ domain-containing protein [Oceanicoccus sp.]